MKAKESLTKKTFTGFFWSASGKMTVAIIQIIVLAILARLVSVESFGLVQAALIVIGFAKLISKMGIGPALVQREDLTEKHIRVGFTFSLCLGLVLGLLIFLFAPLLASFFKIDELSKVLKVVSLLFLSESFVTVSGSLIQREMRLKERAIVEMLSYTFGYGLIGITLAYYGFDYWALIAAIFGQDIIRVVSYSIMRKHSIRFLWKRKELKDLLNFGGGVTINQILSYFALQGDNIIVGRMLGANALGLYSRAYALMTKPSSIIGEAIDKALFPAMSLRQGEPEKLKKAFLNGAKLITVISIPISIILIISSKEIVYTLLGKEWKDAIIPFQILTLGLVFRMGYKIAISLTRATGKVYDEAKRQFIYGASMIAFSLIGSYWGIIGVSIGTLLSITLNYILLIDLSLKILNIKWKLYISELMKELPIMIFLALLYFLLYRGALYVTNSNIMILFISIGLFSIFFVTLFFYFGHKLSFYHVLPFKKYLKKNN